MAHAEPMQLKEPTRGREQQGEQSEPVPSLRRPRPGVAENARRTEHDERADGDREGGQPENQRARRERRTDMTPDEGDGGRGQPTERARHAGQRPQRTRQTRAGAAGERRPDGSCPGHEHTEATEPFRDGKGTQDNPLI